MEPILVEEKREQAEQQLKENKYADALATLEQIARLRGPEAREHAAWARDQIPKTQAALRKARNECQAASRLAEQLLEEYQFAEAVELLAKFQRGSRTPEAEEILKESQRALKKITKLNAEIDRATYHKETDTDEFYDTVVELLELNPKDRRARQLYKKLEEQRKSENSLIWRLGLGLLALACLVAVGWVVKLVVFPEGGGTVTIILDTPGWTVYVDDELLPSDDLDKPLDRYRPGEHKLELRKRTGPETQTISKQSFTVDAHLDKILHVGVEPDDVPMTTTDPLPAETETEPLEQQTVAELPMEVPMEVPSAPPMEPPPPVEPPKINGFPVAKQTAYLPLEGPAGTPVHAVFSLDTSRLAAGRLSSNPDDVQKTYDVRIWDTATGKPAQILSALGGELQGIAFSPDAKFLATASADAPDAKGGVVQVWELATGALKQSTLLTTPPGQTNVEVRSVAYSPDGGQVAVVNQNAVFVWNVTDGKAVFQRSLAPADLREVSFSPDGGNLLLGALGSPDGVFVWNIQRNAQMTYLPVGDPLTNAHPAFTVSPDRTVMATINENNVRRFDTSNGQTLNSSILPPFLNESQSFTDLSYSPDGRFLLASGPGRRPLIWEASTSDRTAILGEQIPVGSYAARFTPDSKFVLQMDRPDASDLSGSAAVLRTWQIAN